MKIKLNSHQRKYLRGLAHGLKPIVFVGQMGLTAAVEKALEEALDSHELVKIKFNDNKDKAFKRETLDLLERSSGAAVVAMIGHTGIFYRPHPQEEKRRIQLPSS